MKTVDDRYKELRRDANGHMAEWLKVKGETGVFANLKAFMEFSLETFARILHDYAKTERQLNELRKAIKRIEQQQKKG